MRYCFDIDGTICSIERGIEKDYRDAKPFIKRIEKVNRLYYQGNHIIFFTARGSLTKLDWRKITEMQLKHWGVKYHELIFGKPDAVIYVDDKGMNDKDFFKEMKVEK